MEDGGWKGLPLRRHRSAAFRLQKRKDSSEGWNLPEQHCNPLILQPEGCAPMPSS